RRHDPPLNHIPPVFTDRRFFFISRENTAMTSPAATLRELHRLRRHAKDLQTEIERAPRLLKAHHAKVTRQEETLRLGQEALKRLKVVMHDKEGELKTAQQLVAKYEDQRNKATSKKEYDAAQ